MPSKKQTKSGTATPGGAAAAKRWTVALHKDVAKDIVHYGFMCPDFVPIWDALVDQLETNPKQFPKKAGKLKTTRAAPFKYGSTAHRVVYTISEASQKVFVIACDPHDEAYAKASRRLKAPKAR